MTFDTVEPFSGSEIVIGRTCDIFDVRSSVPQDYHRRSSRMRVFVSCGRVVLQSGISWLSAESFGACIRQLHVRGDVVASCDVRGGVRLVRDLVMGSTVRPVCTASRTVARGPIAVVLRYPVLDF